MNKKTLLISEKEIAALFEEKYYKAIDIVEDAFLMRYKNDIDLPTKISQIFDEKSQNRINCMPSTLILDKMCGVKWVSVFPENPLQGLRNVTGTIVLSEIEHGFTLSVMDGTYITGIRTAAVGAVASKYLARENSKTIGFIGAGHEARKHFEMIKVVRPNIDTCYVSSRRTSTVEKFIEEESVKYPSVRFINCGDNFERAVVDADIVVTATSTQKDLLKANWIKKGATYIHVGGWEDEFAVAQKANKIVCDEWECVKHRSQTISRMYSTGLLTDDDIYSDLPLIIAGNKIGRETEEEFIYFNSVGLAFIDIMFAKYVFEICRDENKGTYFEF